MSTAQLRSCFLLLLLPICAVSARGEQAPQQRQITVVFRYDDYGDKSNTADELQLLQTFQRHHMPLTIGVIPARKTSQSRQPALHELQMLSSAKTAILREAVASGLVECAMHGLSHQQFGVEGNSSYEFADLDSADALYRIQLGKHFLETAVGQPVTTFIPPWDVYSRATLEALPRAGFTTLSASAGHLADNSPLKFLPKTTDLWTLYDAVPYARTTDEPSPIIVVMFHPHDLAGLHQGKPAIEEIGRLLDFLAAQPDVTVLTVAQAAAADPTLTAERYAAYGRWCASDEFKTHDGARRHRTLALYRQVIPIAEPNFQTGDDDLALVRPHPRSKWLLLLLIAFPIVIFVAIFAYLRRWYGSIQSPAR
jgi:peptidoglycan/xylan/chitin deacetylase (PgdA/CDA1 family)